MAEGCHERPVVRQITFDDFPQIPQKVNRVNYTEALPNVIETACKALRASKVA